jgi:hypothetical protein
LPPSAYEVGPDGRVLTRDVEVEGYPLKAGTAVTLDEGRIRRFVLSRDYPAVRLPRPGLSLGDPVVCKAGEVVDLLERSATLAEDQTIRGLAVPAGSKVSVHCDFGIVTVVLARPCEVAGVACPAGSRLTYPTMIGFPKGYIGILITAVLHGAHLLGLYRLTDFDVDVAGDTVVQGVHVPARSLITLTREGRLKSMLLREPATISGVPCLALSGRERTEVEFHPDGALERFTLSREHRFEETTYRAGDRITLDRRGRVTRCTASERS